MTPTYYSIFEEAWRQYREGCATICASKTDFLAGFEASQSSNPLANEILEALKGLFKAGQKQGWDHHYEYEMEAARVAIAKAEGRS